MLIIWVLLGLRLVVQGHEVLYRTDLLILDLVPWCLITPDPNCLIIIVSTFQFYCASALRTLLGYAWRITMSCLCVSSNRPIPFYNAIVHCLASLLVPLLIYAQDGWYYIPSLVFNYWIQTFTLYFVLFPSLCLGRSSLCFLLWTIMCTMHRNCTTSNLTLLAAFGCI